MARPEPKRKPRKTSALGRLTAAVPRRARLALGVVFALACAFGAASALASGCSGWDPREPFQRRSPEVNDAIQKLDAGSLASAEQTLETYLGTGACGDAGIGLPDSVRKLPNGSFDLGLTLFYMGEKYGRRFGEEEQGDGGADDALAAQRSLEVDCALIVLRAIASDAAVPVDLRARARYLSGNLEFLRRRYEDAVKQYDQALGLVPGLPIDAGGDGIGRDAAWNRAIALRRIDDQKDAGPDAEPDAPPDAPQDAPPDAPPDAAPDAEPDSGPDAGPDAGDDGGKDGGQDAGEDAGADGGKGDGGDGKDGGSADAGGQDGGQPPPEPKPEPAAPDTRQDDRMLDQLEEAPTYQEQEAKSRAGRRRARGMEDK